MSIETTSSPIRNSYRISLVNVVGRYALAIAAALVASALRMALTPFLDHQYPYLTAFAAVAFAAWYCGFGPAMITMLMSAVNMWIWLHPENPSNLFQDMTDLYGMIGFFLFSSVIILMGNSNRRAREQSEDIERSLRQNEVLLLGVKNDMQAEIDRRTGELERRTTQILEQAKLIDLANDAIFVRTADHRISYWNSGAERLYGWTKDEAIGRLAADLMHTQFPISLSELAKTERWEGELRQVRRDGTPIVVASRWTTLRDRDGNFAGWLEINTDITARKRAEDAARTLSGRLLSLQDDERRRIARELHDSLGQYLVSVKLNLDVLSAGIADPKQQGVLDECLRSVDQCLSETRTISHLLHPPLLDEAGFESAARWYIEGFGQRSGIHVDVDFPKPMERFDREIETALFRALQEALTNVHRHSGGSKVEIALKLEVDRVELRVTDNGRGIEADRLRSLQEDDSSAGVGLAGMRQRVRELGGTLQIRSADPGTALAISIPLMNRGKLDRREANLGASAA